VQGVDIWLNTPMRPKEASGTSGMKAVMNGVLNFSVLDGWWAEGYVPGAGWALPLEATYQDQNLQNELDAETIYNLLEEEIVPAYFDRDEQGIPRQWVQHIRKTFSEVAPHFTMKRMLDDYYERFYNKLYARTHQMQLSNLADATRLTEWKHKVEHLWNGIEVRRSEIYDTANFALPMGSKFTAAIWLNLNGLQPDELGLELVFFKRFGDNELNIKLRTELVFKKMEDGAALYECAVEPGMAGVYEYGVRMFPRHELLPHRQDFALAKWV
ncbi:MAG TPA: alpha-glucan family phosphorylase, partial [Saprospiraceae bacterium]|nr:alpha-glucan family phosphorylase [Saprospiraceae bacterium]